MYVFLSFSVVDKEVTNKSTILETRRNRQQCRIFRAVAVASLSAIARSQDPSMNRLSNIFNECRSPIGFGPSESFSSKLVLVF